MAKLNMEIHCIKIERLHNSSSVTGQVSGSGMSIRGIGAANVSGSTTTTHTAQMSAGGKVYEFENQGSFPLSEGDDIVVLCQYIEKKGMYKVWSFINNTNGSRHLETNGMLQFYLWFAGVFLSIFFFLIFTAIGAMVAYWYAARLTFVIAPLLKEGNQMLLKLDGVTDRSKIEAILKSYSGKTKLVGYN